MKKSIKTIINIFIILMLMLATKSYAALESKKGGTKDTKEQEAAFQLCYDMRNPTSSLGNNSLEPHLQLNKDVGAYAYLGMSAYGTNGEKATYNSGGFLYYTTPNYTGITDSVQKELTAGIYLPKGVTSSVVQKYGRNKYTEIFEEKPNLENTKGMAILETKGWYNTHSTDYVSGWTVMYRDHYWISGSTYRYSAYGYGNGAESNTIIYYRPVIWNQ